MNPETPEVGAIIDGYRFNGGNPSDPASWEQVSGPEAAGFTSLGDGWWRGPDGGTYQVGDRGAMVQRTTGGGAGGGGVGATPEQRGRIAIGLPNALAAEQRISAMEQGLVDDRGQPIPGAQPGEERRNWFNEDWGASLIDRMGDDEDASTRGPLASWVGGSDYQLYEQANRSVEAAFLPVLSGAAVTATEAERFIRANLPVYGDGPDVLAEKAANRQRMLNAAAAIMGEELPYPGIGLFGGMVTAYEQDRGLAPGTLEGIAAGLSGQPEPVVGGIEDPTMDPLSGPVAGAPEGGLPRNPDGTLRDGPVNLQQIIEGVAPEDRPGVLMRLGLRAGDEIMGADGDVEVLVSDPRLAETEEDTRGAELQNGVAYRQLDADALRDARERSASTPDALRSITQGAAYNFSDEIDAFGAGLETRISGLFGHRPGYTPDEANAAVRFSEREAMDQFAEERPVTDLALRVGGSFAAPGMIRAGRWAGAPMATGGARPLAQSMTRGAAVAGVSGAAYGAGAAEEGGRGQGAMTGGVTGVAVGAGLPVVGRLVGSMIGRGGSAGGGNGGGRSAQVRMLREEGVSLTPGQRIGGLANAAETLAMRAPILGTAIRGARERGTESLNRAVLNRALDPIGEGLPANVGAGAEAVDYTAQRLGREFDEAAAAIPQAAPDDAFNQGLAAVRGRLSDLGDDGVQAFERFIGNRLGRLQGPVSGAQLRQIEREVAGEAARFSKSQNASEQQLGDLYESVADELRGLLARSSPDGGARLGAARQGYTDYVRAERASTAAGGAPFSPGHLRSAVRQSDNSVRSGAVGRGQARLQDLSRAASAVMPDNFGNPGTADAIGWGGLGAVTLTNPAAGAATAGGLAAAATPYFLMGRKVIERLPRNASRQQVEAAEQELGRLSRQDPNVIRLTDELRQRFGRGVAGVAGGEQVDRPSMIERR